MERRYEDLLNQRFDEVQDVGFAVISLDEVNRWWNRQRITSSIWQDLNERWEERDFRGAKNAKVPLLIAEWRSKFIISWGEPDWLTPVKDFG